MKWVDSAPAAVSAGREFAGRLQRTIFLAYICLYLVAGRSVGHDEHCAIVLLSNNARMREGQRAGDEYTHYGLQPYALHLLVTPYGEFGRDMKSEFEPSIPACSGRVGFAPKGS